MPSVEGEVSQAAGAQGSSVLRGGGSGMVESQVGGVGDASAEQEVVAATRGSQGDLRDLQFGAGSASVSVSGATQSGIGRAENLEFSQRDQVVARSRQAEDAHAQARRVVDDPAAVGTERAEMEASQHIGDAMPIDPNRVEDQAGTVTDAVDDPGAMAQSHAEGAVSAQQGEAEVKLGVRGSAGQSREEITGAPPTGEKK